MRNSSVDLNSVLKVANLVVAGLIVFGWAHLDDTSFVDSNTMWLGIALCAQTHAALWLETRKRDPFVLLLAFWMIVYFEFRIFTLASLGISSVFWRFDYHASDSNYALAFILAANLFMYAGFLLARRDGSPEATTTDWRASAPLRVVFLILGSLALTYLTGSYWSEGSVPRGINFLVLYFAPSVILLMALAYVFLFRRTLKPTITITIAVLIVTEIVAHTLLGSRGAIVGFVQTCLIVLLAIYGCVRLSRRFLVFTVTLSPLILGIMVVAFMVSSYIRSARAIDGANLSVGLEMLDRVGDAGLDSRPVEFVLGSVAARIGYLDMSAEIIAHEQQYAPVLNWAAYGRSLVDNLLTPGTDLYDQPKIANSLMFVYRGLGVPSKKLASDEYQSDQLGIYGEFYVLGYGWASLPAFFLVAFVFRRMFERTFNRNPFFRSVGRAVVLFAFARLFESFGFDWVIIEMLPFVVAIFIYGFFFPTRRCGPVALSKRANAA